jgi:hypothetical protein
MTGCHSSNEASHVRNASDAAEKVDRRTQQEGDLLLHVLLRPMLDKLGTRTRHDANIAGSGALNGALSRPL